MRALPLRFPPPSSVALVAAVALGACTDAPTGAGGEAALARGVAFPEVIALPDGFWPEGIAAGRGTTIFVGSIAGGAIWRGDARTGAGDILVASTPDGVAVGMDYDARGDRLFVAGGPTGLATVYDASTGAVLAEWQLGAPGLAFPNDVIVLRDAAYFTESFAPVLYRIPLAPNGALLGSGAVEVLPLGDGFTFVPGDFNANGIVATPDGKRLIVANTATGALYVVDPADGRAAAIDLGGAALTGADGLLLVGHTLYVVQGELNRVAVVRLEAGLTRGAVEQVITGANLDFPSTAAHFGSSLYVVNARFGVEPGPTVEYWVTRLPR